MPSGTDASQRESEDANPSRRDQRRDEQQTYNSFNSGDQYNCPGGTQNHSEGHGTHFNGANFHGPVTFGHGKRVDVYQKLLRSLAFPEMDHRAHDIWDPTTGTCNWLLRHEEYIAWASSNDGGLLWIKGLPGSGKSTLLRYAIDNIKSSANLGDGAIVLSFFYHGRGSDLQRSPVGLYRSLLYQLGHIHGALLPSIMATFTQRYSTFGDKLEWRLGELQRMLKSVLRQVVATCPVWLFVDALDESGEDNAVALIDSFRSWSRDLEQDGLLRKPFRVCFTCRHYPNLPTWPGERKIYVEKENGRDIETFIRNKTGLVLNAGPTFPIWNMIIQRASGVFLWVWLVMEEVLAQERRGATRQMMEATISRVPNYLDDLYLRSIGKMGTESLLLMQWVCFARSPLNLDQWRWAAVMDANCQYRSLKECTASENFRPHYEKLSRQLRELSCGLIEATDKGLIQFIHQTTRDFFLDKGITTLARQLNQSSMTRSQVEAEAHYRLSRSCIRYLAMAGIARDSPQNWSYSRKQFPFLSYSVHHWPAHAKMAEKANGTNRNERLSDYFSRQLLQLYLQLNDKLGQGASFLHITCYFGLVEPLKGILRGEEGYAVAVSAQDDRGRTPLSYAAQHGHTAAARYLLEPEHNDPKVPRRVELAQLEIADHTGRTPLLWAADEGHTDIVRLLIDRGAQVHSIDQEYWTPVSRAAQKGHHDTVRLLLDRGAQAGSINQQGRKPLLWAAYEGHTDIARLLVDRGAQVDYIDEGGRTPLSWAAVTGRENVVRLLLDRHAQVDSLDQQGRTPLSWAAANSRNTQTVNLLLGRGAQVDSTDQQGRTPLSWAAATGHMDVVRLLLDRGAQVDSLDQQGRTPLSWAAAPYVRHYTPERTQPVEVLLNNNADIDRRDNDGRTPLSHAAGSGPNEATRTMPLLVQKGAMVDTPDNAGRTPLSWAASSGYIYNIKLLLYAGAREDYVDVFDRMAIKAALEKVGGLHWDVAYIRK